MNDQLDESTKEDLRVKGAAARQELFANIKQSVKYGIKCSTGLTLCTGAALFMSRATRTAWKSNIGVLVPVSLLGAVGGSLYGWNRVFILKTETPALVPPLFSQTIHSNEYTTPESRIAKAYQMIINDISQKEVNIFLHEILL
jgi:hypothetical protein